MRAERKKRRFLFCMSLRTLPQCAPCAPEQKRRPAERRRRPSEGRIKKGERAEGDGLEVDPSLRFRGPSPLLLWRTATAGFSAPRQGLLLGFLPGLPGGPSLPSCSVPLLLGFARESFLEKDIFSCCCCTTRPLACASPSARHTLSVALLAARGRTLPAAPLARPRGLPAAAFPCLAMSYTSPLLGRLLHTRH